MVSMRVEKDHTDNTANKNVGMHANRREEKRKRVQIENMKKTNSGTHGNVLRDMTNDEQRQVAFSLKKKANGERERERERERNNNPVDDDDDSSSSPFQQQRLRRRRRRKPLLRKVVREDFSLLQIL
jgi:hypothetical protein